MSFLSDSLPAPWDFLALLKILLSCLLPARTGLLFSAVLLLLGRFLWKKSQAVQHVAGTCCRQLLLFLTQRPTGSFQTKTLCDAAATTLPQWLFLAERPVLQQVKVL